MVGDSFDMFTSGKTMRHTNTISPYLHIWKTAPSQNILSSAASITHVHCSIVVQCWTNDGVAGLSSHVVQPRYRYCIYVVPLKWIAHTRFVEK